MRIGVEAQRILRYKKHGMDFVVLELLKQLQKIDTINEYFIFCAPGPDKEVIKETPNFKLIFFSAPYPIWEQYLLPKQVKRLNLDLLHSTSNTAPIRVSSKMVVTVHDIIFLETSFWKKGYTAYQRFGNLYRKWNVPRILKKADRIITVSNFEKKNLLNAGFDASKIEVVYNGVGAHFKVIENKQILEQAKNKYNLPDKYILFLGNTDPKKNTPNTLLAFAQYCKKYGTNYKLVVADLTESYARQVLNDANLQEFKEAIYFAGYVNNHDLPCIINAASLFLYPSKRESFGIPLLEAMKCGVPVITGQTSSLPEIAGDAALKVDVSKTEAIAEAIHQVLTSEALRNTLIKNGLERSGDFSWANSANKVLDIYKAM